MADAPFQNASMLTAIESRFNNLIGEQSGYLQTLSPQVRNRINALLNLTRATDSINHDFQREVELLERKFEALYKPVYKKRSDIISGNYEPDEEECLRTVEEDTEDELPESEGAEDLAVKGIPEFWLTALKNLPPFMEEITEADEDVLKHLVDIQTAFMEEPGFELSFHFKENDYFTNKVLTKRYFLMDSEEAHDLVYDHAEGCTINWKDGKDLSFKIEIKKQRHKATNKTRTVKKTVPQPTFFEFFKDLDQDDDEGEDGMSLAERDYETGEMIKEKLIPDAIDWFTGRALEEFDDYDEEEEGDEYGDGQDFDEEEEESDDEDEGNAPGGPADKAPECKQQ